MVRENLQKCSKERHPKDPLYDNKKGESVTE